ncbi:hypothetical protein [Jeongeupia chitinilytica]|uniref:Uncharacterized protein n=1 Tax=Jeongeupia chitinilytica TaxID=1041641 RepID=A0ABQ3H1A5_9NEIS|nr:hypothetical protein [Jeongeupia chitinilytica]GHD60810.1 hypothetical protein GCM10007350_14420 [Jeongeupia chitinilytica]
MRLPSAWLTVPPAGGWRVLLLAALGALVLDLPVRLHGASAAWSWTVLGSLACAAIEAAVALRVLPPCRRSAMLACLAAVGVGTWLDFSRIAPEALLSFCTTSAAADWLGLPLEHLRWFPFTALLMLAVVVQERVDGRFALPALGWVMVEFAAMLLVMALGMVAFKGLALSLGLPWVANGMVGAMLLSMLAFSLLHAGIQLAFAAWPLTAGQAGVRR